MEFPGFGGHLVTAFSGPPRTALGSRSLEVTVASGSIVEAINVVGHIVQSQLSVLVHVLLDPFFFQTAEERLRDGIVTAVLRGSGFFGRHGAWVLRHNSAPGARRRAVKKKRFSVEQITAVLQQVDKGIPVGDVCRQTGISE
jgi:hypothetical protein